MRRLEKNGSRPTPVILGAHINALGLARALGKGGIASVVVSDIPDIALYSRHAVARLLPNPRSHPTEFGEALLAMVEELSHGGILLSTSDEYLKALVPVRARLEASGLIFAMAPQETLDIFSSKRETHALARDLKVPVPDSVDILGEELETAAAQLRFPAILKPEETVGFSNALGIGRQTIFLEGMDQARDAQNRLVAAELGTRSFVLQEYIPGPVDRLYTISTFSDRSGRIHAYSTGHKVRQHPPEAGTICRGYVVPTPSLLAPTERLFAATSFFGIANTEYKFDERDGEFKLIEVNPRPGKWNSSATLTGVNLPLLAYKYLVEDVLPSSVVTSDSQAVWTDLLGYMSSLQEEHGFLGMIRSLFWPDKRITGRKLPAVFAVDDPSPGLWWIGSFGLRVCRRMPGFERALRA